MAEPNGDVDPQERYEACEEAFREAIHKLEERFGAIHVTRAASDYWSPEDIDNAKEHWDDEYNNDHDDEDPPDDAAP